jgi:signal transduction histidine kinase
VLDTSEVQPLIDAISSGLAPVGNWAEALLDGARIVEVAQQVEERVGAFFGREDMLHRPIGSFWPPESRADLADLILEIGSGGVMEATRMRAISSLLLRDAKLTVWRTQADRPNRMSVEVQGVARDGRSNWALRASEERYRKLIHHLPFALLQVDAREVAKMLDRLRSDGVEDIGAYVDTHPELIAFAKEHVRITEVNRSAALMLGARDASDLIGPAGPLLFATSRDAVKRVIIARFEGNRSYSETMKLSTVDGRILDVRLSLTFPTPPEQADVTIVSLEDLTDQLRTEAQLRQLQADFGRAARISTLGELATSIAHEVNQPLAAILTNAETSLRWLNRADPNLEKIGQLTSRIVMSAERASEIVQRIRGMAARHVPERTLLDLNAVVYEALLFVRHDLETRAIGLALDLGTRLPHVLGDRVLLQQVIVNLLLNAIQAISQTGAHNGRIELATNGEPDGTVGFVIRDFGPGIAPDDLNRVFDGFFTTKEEGMGIGLAICQSIGAAPGGTIAASNHPEGGAVFRFSLPGTAA